MVGRERAEARTVDEYLGLLPSEERSALLVLRRTIHAVVPGVEEGISYRMPVFSHQGLLVGLAAMTGHLGFYVMSPAVVAAHLAELKDYDVGKGCIRFSASKPLPEALLRTRIRARVLENERAATTAKSRTGSARRAPAAKRRTLGDANDRRQGDTP
jgi:uncharacterized protein YdhG (YjbR/CyaY superfamily)